MLWKHVDAETGAQVRRMRRMVVSTHVTVANYEYLVYWRFYQDGNIECEIRASGLMVTTPMESDGDSSPYGTTVDTADLRAVPPALHHRQARPGHRRRREHGGRGGLGRRADQPRTTRTGWRCPHRTTTIESESQSARDYNWETPANLEGDQPQQGEPARQQHRLQAGARSGDPIAVGPFVARSTSERRSLTTPFG